MHTIPAVTPVIADAAGRAVERNLWSYNDTFALLPRSRSHRGADVNWVSTGTLALNRVYDARLASVDVERCVADVLARFQAWRQPFHWQVTPSTRPADLGAVLEDNGFRHSATLAGMACDLTAPLPAPEKLPAGFTRTEVASADGVARWIEVLVRANDASTGLALAWEELFTRLKLGFDVPWQFHLGCLDGMPVATIATHRGGGALGLYLVSTVSEARGRGVAGALVRAALEEARERGETIVTLQSQARAMPLYHRLGFTERCPIDLYRWIPGTET